MKTILMAVLSGVIFTNAASAEVTKYEYPKLRGYPIASFEGEVKDIYQYASAVCFHLVPTKARVAIFLENERANCSASPVVVHADLEGRFVTTSKCDSYTIIIKKLECETL